MTSLLDKFNPATTSFVPRTPQDVFALRLAQKLNDATAVAHYATLAATHSEGQLLSAYSRAIRATGVPDLGRRFQTEINRAHKHFVDFRSNLLAIRVERRSIAAAVFFGDHIEYTQVRQLSSIKEKALGSAVGFVNWILSRFSVESAVLEAISKGNEIQRRVLTDSIAGVLRGRQLAIWEVPKQLLFASFGYPALKSRKELREVISNIWPILSGTNGKASIRDAVALGLHVQTERLFIQLEH